MDHIHVLELTHSSKKNLFWKLDIMVDFNEILLFLANNNFGYQYLILFFLQVGAFSELDLEKANEGKIYYWIIITLV